MGAPVDVCKGTCAFVWDGKGRSPSQRKADHLLCLSHGAGVGGVAREGHSPLLLPFVLILELGTGVRRFYFFPRAPAKNPITLSTPALLCFSGMCFHLKTTLGHFFFPVLKIEKFLQYEQGCGGG
uniref:Uncharacterized protein n=1 Tax=Balaenoptera musculus TaxID=9771 RepID=A0A8C0DHZ2_BALMU